MQTPEQKFVIFCFVTKHTQNMVTLSRGCRLRILLLPPSLNKSTHFVRHEQSLHGTKWKKFLNLRVVIRKTLNTVDASLSTF